MYWIEAVIETLSSEDGMAAEIIAAALMECGVDGIQTEDAYEMGRFLENNEEYWDYVEPELVGNAPGKALVKFYVPDDDTGREVIESVKNALSGLKRGEFSAVLGTLALDENRVNDENWLDNWKKYYKPFKIAEKIVIRPLWEDYSPQEGEIVAVIDPGHVFGTGLHQTTRMCVESLAKHVKKGQKILDMGCGSGILSIIGMLLSETGDVTAVDTDRQAVAAACENVAHNGLSARFRVLAGNVLKDRELLEELKTAGKFNVILANIIADVIIGIAPLMKGLLAQGGVFVASGIINERLPDVLAALAQNGFEALETITDGDWVCVASVL